MEYAKKNKVDEGLKAEMSYKGCLQCKTKGFGSYPGDRGKPSINFKQESNIIIVFFNVLFCIIIMKAVWRTGWKKRGLEIERPDSIFLCQG